MADMRACPSCGKVVPDSVIATAEPTGRALRCSCGDVSSVDGLRVIDDPIQHAFEGFHGSHPEVYELFKRFAWELRNAGQKRIGAKAVWERLRYETQVNPERYSGFKLNNNFTSRYARRLIADDPSFRSLIEVRRLQSVET